MKPLPIEGSRTLTYTLGELYNVVAALLQEIGLDRETPVGMYTRDGIRSILALAQVGPKGESAAACGLVCLIGEEVPYGVALEGVLEIEVADREPHADHGAVRLSELLRRKAGESGA